MEKRTLKNEKTEQRVKKSKHTHIFMLAKNNNGEVIIVMGKYQASEKTFSTWEQADAYIAAKPYELILNMTLIHNIYEKENNSKEMEKDA